MDDPRSDLELVEAINRGGAEGTAAFEALYRRYRDWVAALACRLTGDRDAALDVLQETFLYFLRKTPGFVLTASFKTFLYPAVQHLAIAARRKAKRLLSDGAALEGQAAPAPSPHAPEAAGTRQELAEVLAGLPEGQREVVLLRFVDGLSMEEIAQALEVPTGTVKSRLHNALNALRSDPRVQAYFAP